MKIIALVLVVVLVVSCVAVGAFNNINGTNNKPMGLYDTLKTFSDLDLGLGITTDTYQRYIEILVAFFDDSYQLEDDYIDGSVWEKLWLNWTHNSLLLYILEAGSALIMIALSLALDSLVTSFKLIVFGYRLLFGVPS